MQENLTRPAGSPVLVMVFYEALCPDSKNFIIKQLHSAYVRAPSLIDIQFVPYGKATVNSAIIFTALIARSFHHILLKLTKPNSINKLQTTVNHDGSLGFECQHGHLECEANIYHACAVEAIQEPKVALDMVACMIQNNIQPKEAMISCAKENHVDYEAIQKCYDSPHGQELLKLHGEATDSLRPPVTFIPTITLDGSQGRQASILKDLFGEVCKVAAGHGPLPAECK